MFLSKRVLVAAATVVAMSLAGASGAHAVAAKAKGAKIVDPTVQKTHMHGHKHGHKHASAHKHGHKHMSMHKHGHKHAHKHGHKHMSMHGYVAAPAAKPAAKTAVKAKGPGSCGTYMYWKAGKCNDARAPKKV